MAEMKETGSVIVASSDEGIKTQSSVELQTIQAAYKLDGKNYLKWSQLIRTILKGKGKITHLLGTGPKQGDASFEAWDEEDSLIMAWLWNSMMPEISDTVMFMATAKDIWDAIQQTYSKAKDAAQVYEVKVKTIAAKQGSKSVTEYANQLKSLWQELDHYRVIQTKCPDDAAILKEFIEQDRVYDFLVGLNPEFDQVRIQILGKQKVPCFNEVVAIIRSEESRRTLMLDPQTAEGSAMVAGGAKHGLVDNEKRPIAETGRGIQFRPQNRDELWCTYCRKARHTWEKCWKLHGKPPSREWGQKGYQPRGNGQVHIVTNATQEEDKQELKGLNQDEVEKVRTFFNNMEKPIGTCTLAYSGTHPFSFGFNASKTPFQQS